MDRVVCVAARSGILVLVAFVIMSAVWCATMPGAPLQYRIDALGVMFTNPVWWVMPLLGWPGLFAWTHFTMKDPSWRQSRWMQAAWWIVSTLVAAFAMVAIIQGVDEVNSLLHGMRFPSTGRSMQRLFVAATIAVVFVRFALLVTPRLDTMPPHNA